MSDTLNTVDAFLQGATTRLLPPATAAIILKATTNNFKIDVSSVATPTSISFVANFIDMDGTVTFSSLGCTLTSVSGNTCALLPANMAGTTATVTATMTYRGTVFSNTVNITKILDGAAGAPGNNGLTLISRGVTLTGSDLTKTGGTNASWNADAYSKEGYAGGAYVCGTTTALVEMAIGLSATPSSSLFYNDTDYVIRTTATGDLQFYTIAGPSASGVIGTYVVGDVIGVSYDGTNVKWLKNGVAIRTQAFTNTNPLYFDCSFYTSGSALNNVKFFPLGSNPDGTTALTAINDATTGLAQRMRLNADNILGGVLVASATSSPVGFRAGTVVWNNSGAWVSGSGVAITPAGLVGYNSSGVAQFSISASTGAAVFAGSLSAATGSFAGSLSAATGSFAGSLSAATGSFAGSLSAATGSFAGSLSAVTGTFGAVTIASGGSVSSGQTAYNTGTGFWLGSVSGTPKLSIGTAGGARLTWDGSVLTIAGETKDAFSVTLGGISAGSYGPYTNGTTQTIGTKTSSVSGGVAPYTYSWLVEGENYDGTPGTFYASGGTTSSSVTVKAAYTGPGGGMWISGGMTLTVTDANGRVCTASAATIVKFGTYTP